MKKGFTLMELLVYMALLGAIVVIAGRAFTDSTKFRVRTHNIISANQEAGNVGPLLQSDISQMGSKSDTTYVVHDTVYMDPRNNDPNKRDSSSYILCTTVGDSNSTCLASNPDYDSLFIRYIRYNDSGAYKAVEEAHWYVENKVLKRACRTVAGDTTGGNCRFTNMSVAKDSAVEIASGVERFKVFPARPRSSVTIFPPDSTQDTTGGNESALMYRLVPRTDSIFVNVNVANEAGSINFGGLGQKLGGGDGPFFSNWSNRLGDTLPNSDRKLNQLVAIIDNGNTPGTWKDLCRTRGGHYNGSISLLKDAEYELSFSMTGPSVKPARGLLFVPGKDHMSVGFRDQNGQPPKNAGHKIVLDDFMFYPPLEVDRGNGKRVVRFTVPDSLGGLCIAFTFAFFSPLASQGTYSIDSLRLRKLPYSSYDIDTVEVYLPSIRNKKNIKAFRVRLQVGRGGKADQKGETGEFDMVIPTPSNGPRD